MRAGERKGAESQGKKEGEEEKEGSRARGSAP